MRSLICVVLAVFCSTNYCYSQSKSFKKLAADLNNLTDIYGNLMPFQISQVALKDYGLTAADFTETYVQFLSQDKDSVDVSTLQDYLKIKIAQKLDQLTAHKDFGTFDLSKLLTISYIKSPDSKLYNFIYDENTGGTYQSRVPYIYYIGQKGKHPEDFYHNDGYNSIIPLQTGGGLRYILSGTVTGCGTCQRQYIKVVHYKDGLPIEDFDYTLDVRAGMDNSIDYNIEDKTITVHYFTDDLAQYCQCNDGDTKYNDDALDTVHQCTCVFKFNGSTFELVSKKDLPFKN